MLDLRALGSLDIRDAEGYELRSVVAQPKRVALLVYLLLATPRGFQRRDSILPLFWPDQDTERARNALNQAVHFLRRTLGSDVVLSRNGDELAVDGTRLSCDVVSFEEALKEDRLADAVEVFRGDFLEGFHVVDVAPGFERWVERERLNLAERFNGVLERLAIEREAAQDKAGAVLWWRRLAARDPYNPRPTLRLMHALVSAGDVTAAIQQGQIHEKLRREVLEVEPDQAVSALIKELRSRPPTGIRAPTPRPGPEKAESRLRSNSGVKSGWALSLNRRATGLLAIVFIALFGLAWLARIQLRAESNDPSEMSTTHSAQQRLDSTGIVDATRLLKKVLVDYVNAQERYYASHNTYAGDVQYTDLQPVPLVRVAVLTFGPKGQSAVALYESVPGLICAVWVGQSPRPLDDPSKEGVPSCRTPG